MNRVFFVELQPIFVDRMESAAQPPTEIFSTMSWAAGLILGLLEHRLRGENRVRRDPHPYESELVMSEYRRYSIPPEHAGHTRVLTSGCRHATTAAQAQAGASALIAARILLTTDAVGDPSPLLLDHGGADGADTAVWQAAGDAAPGWETVCHPAQWNTHVFEKPQFEPGDAEQDVNLCPPRHRGTDRCLMAGHRRNSAMIALGPKLLLAMPTASKAQARELGRSRGTWGCVDAAQRAGIPTLIVWSPDGGVSTPFRLFWSDELTAQMITSHWSLRHLHARELASPATATLAVNSIDLAEAAVEVPF